MSNRNKQWYVRAGVAVTVLVAFLIGLSLRGDSPGPAATEAGEEAASTWTCSMHPQIQLPEPGQCPICGMDLIPLESTGGDDRGPRSLTLSAHARALAEIRTAPVERRAVTTTLRLVGMLEAAETRVRQIAARVAGRIDRLHVDATGVAVRAGQPLFDLYSPALVSAQEELLQSARTAEKLGRRSLASSRRSAERTLAAARERLRLWGLTSDQIRAVEAQAAPTDHLTIVAPSGGVVLEKRAVEGAYVQDGTVVYTLADLSTLWLQLQVYEFDLAWLAVGQQVEFQTRTYPGEIFTGSVVFVEPVLDERSRSVRVRVEVANAEGRLKPGMFARASLLADVRAADGGLPLVVPSSAPLLTGTRAVIYVADPDDPGRYHGREVDLGPEADGYFVVRDGLAEGEAVVTNGAFKIDSALQILAKDSMMSPGGGAPSPGHDHAGLPQAGAAPAEEPLAEIAGVPDGFRRQLDQVLAGYLGLGTALSRDDLAKAQAAARSFPDALAQVDHALLPEAGHAPWQRARQDLARFSAEIAAAVNIKTARAAFFDLSARMIATVRQFRTSGRTPLHVFHCPMANRGEGADWLQVADETENPYYGSQMFRCGAKTETLVGASTAETGSDHKR